VRARQQHVDRSRVVACQVAKIRNKIDDGRGGRERFRDCQVTKSRFFIYVILMFQSGLV